MITPPNGVVLDMFAGSGTTGVAAVQCGFHYILIEQEQEYIDIIRARLAHVHAGSPSSVAPVREKRVVYGGGIAASKTVARCPEHDGVKPTGFSGNCYTCGCKILYAKSDTTPAHAAVVKREEQAVTLWEEVTHHA